MRKHLLYIMVLMVVVGLNSCTRKTEQVKPPELGYEYFPVDVGRFQVYKVDSVFFNDFTFRKDTFRFFVKEKIESVFTDAAGRDARRLVRYYRNNPSEEWVIGDIWMMNRTAYTAEKVEENQRMVKLVFPVKKDARWDGHRYNGLPLAEYRFLDVHVPRNVHSFVFDSTLNVLQMADSNLIERKLAFEWYAKNVGMIYKRYINLLDKDSVINFTLPFMQRADFGYDYTYTLIDYGKE
jgi:hypothetical protein